MSPVPNQTVVGTLLVDGLTGPNTDGSVDIRSFSHGATQAATTAGGGGGAGKVDFSDIGVSKAIDSMSPELLKRCAQGTHIPKVTITLYVPGGTTTASTYELEQALVSADNVVNDGSSSSSRLLESVKFSFAKIKVTVGGTVFSWDVAANQAA